MTKKWANSSSYFFLSDKGKKKPSLRTLRAQFARLRTPRFLRFEINKALSTLQGATQLLQNATYLWNLVLTIC